jgi:hypothetical protein
MSKSKELTMADGLTPVEFASSLGITLDDWQKNVVRSRSDRIQVVASRQSGKSMTAALYGLWWALYHEKTTVLVVSPSLRQSALLFKTILDFYKELGRPLPSYTENTSTLELNNSSIIVSLPGVEKTIRGYSDVGCLILDESSLIDEDLYYALRPTLAVSQGKILMIGTPHGRRGFFWDAYENGDEFQKFRITADECPRISKEFLAQEMRAMGPDAYDAEYNCIFGENQAAVFRLDLIKNAIKDYPERDLHFDDDDYVPPDLDVPQHIEEPKEVELPPVETHRILSLSSLDDL